MPESRIELEYGSFSVILSVGKEVSFVLNETDSDDDRQNGYATASFKDVSAFKAFLKTLQRKCEKLEEINQ